MNDPLLSMAQGVLAGQPFNELVGARLASFGDGAATLELEVEDRHRQQHGVVHGGVLSYLADNVLTFAAGTVLGTSVVTGGLSIHYVAAAREGTLRAVGKVVSSSSRQAVCAVDVVQVAPGGASILVAVATGTVLATGRPAAENGAVVIARRLYDALAASDVATLGAVLDPAFSGDVSCGMPLGVGGSVEGPAAMIRDVWGAVTQEYDIRPEPDELVAVAPDRVVVLGHYRGTARRTGRSVEAAFAHDLQIRDGRVTALRQITDTVPWHEALDMAME